MFVTLSFLGPYLFSCSFNTCRVAIFLVLTILNLLLFLFLLLFLLLEGTRVRRAVFQAPIRMSYSVATTLRFTMVRGGLGKRTRHRLELSLGFHLINGDSLEILRLLFIQHSLVALSIQVESRRAEKTRKCSEEKDNLAHFRSDKYLFDMGGLLPLNVDETKLHTGNPATKFMRSEQSVEIGR